MTFLSALYHVYFALTSWRNVTIHWLVQPIFGTIAFLKLQVNEGAQTAFNWLAWLSVCMQVIGQLLSHAQQVIGPFDTDKQLVELVRQLIVKYCIAWAPNWAWVIDYLIIIWKLIEKSLNWIQMYCFYYAVSLIYEFILFSFQLESGNAHFERAICSPIKRKAQLRRPMHG